MSSRPLGLMKVAGKTRGQQLRELASRYEIQVRRNRRLLLLRAFFYMLWGYAWLIIAALAFAILVGLVFACVALLTELRDDDSRFYLAIIGAATGLLMAFVLLVRSIAWVRFDNPGGHKLQRQEAPALFDCVERVRRKLHAPHIHEIRLVGDYNASISRRPRLKGFGGFRNTLILGFPFLQAHSTEEAEAVIGHEIGHILKTEGRMIHWLFWVGVWWSQLAHKPTPGGLLDKLFGKLVQRYTQKLWLFSFVIRRHCEYVADAVAAEFAGAETAARLLVRTNVLTVAMDRQFWPSIRRRAQTEELPPWKVYELLGREVLKPLERGVPEKLVREILEYGTPPLDTHPSPARRCEELGITRDAIIASADAWMQPVPFGSRALNLLPEPTRERFLELLSNEWRVASLAGWRQLHQYEKSGAGRLDRLREKSAKSSLSADETWQLCRTESERLEARERIASLDGFLEDNPGHAEASLSLAATLLECGEHARARDLLSGPAQATTPCKANALELLRAHCEAFGRLGQLMHVEQQIELFQSETKSFEKTRRRIRRKDRFQAPTLTREQMDRLQLIVAGTESIVEAWLSRKAVAQFSDLTVHILVVRLRRANRDLVAQVRLRLQGALAGAKLDILVVPQKSVPRPALASILSAGVRVHTRP